jgi:hypothetical protein
VHEETLSTGVQNRLGNVIMKNTTLRSRPSGIDGVVRGYTGSPSFYAEITDIFFEPPGKSTTAILEPS